MNISRVSIKDRTNILYLCGAFLGTECYSRYYEDYYWLCQLRWSPIEDCKTRWALLRTYYRRAIQRRRTTSGQASKKARKWRFEEQMQFLKTHLQERETASNLTINEEEQESGLLSVETEETESTPPVPSPATSLSPAPAAIHLNN
ncbi:hypothetical protein LSTR_LSTR009228 [Laodelphax striatellus]|uniref:MADF domain-containing protein n=1 Tax=Laodelphax striatellus TaxID=195883 RepID=A0A482XE87_LAOST|nr:hypothetical protein LSTR_LSTR009228 [Laodelphax striatellus]